MRFRALERLGTPNFSLAYLWLYSVYLLLCVLRALRVLCANPLFSYSAPSVNFWERGTSVRHVFYVFITPLCPPCEPFFFLSLCPPCSPGNAGLQSGMSSTFSSFLRALCELLGTPHFSPACLQRFHPSSTPSARTLLFSFSVSSVFSVRTLLFSFSVSSLRTPLFFLRAPAGDFKSQRSSCYTL